MQTAGDGLRVGALFAGKQFDFAGNPVYAVGDRVTVGSTVAIYHGTLRGLWLMRSDAGNLTGASALALCDGAGAAGNGHAWRLPNLREAVGIMFNVSGDDTVQVGVSNVAEGYYGINSVANILPPRLRATGDAPELSGNIVGAHTSLFPSFYTKGGDHLPLYEDGGQFVFNDAEDTGQAVCVAPISDEYGEVDPYAGPELTPDAADAGEVEGPATAVYTLTAQLKHNGPYSASIRADARVAVDVLAPAGYVDNPFSLQTEEVDGPGELQVELLARGPTQNEMLNGLTGEYVATIRAYQPGVSDSPEDIAEITVTMVREHMEEQIFNIIRDSGDLKPENRERIRMTDANARAIRRLLERGAETRYLFSAHDLDAEPPNDRSLLAYAVRTYADIYNTVLNSGVDNGADSPYCQDWQPWVTLVSVFFQHGAHPGGKYSHSSTEGPRSYNSLYHFNGYSTKCYQGGTPGIMRAYLAGVQEYYPDILIEDLINDSQGDYLNDRYARNAQEFVAYYHGTFYKPELYPDIKETADLLYERGGRCRYTFSGQKTGQTTAEQQPSQIFDFVQFCFVPEEEVAAENVPSERTGDLISVQARDFAGVLFDFEPPAAAELETLGRNGWGLAINTDSRPHSAVLSRVREFRQGDENVLLTMRALRADNGEVVRNYVVRGEFAPGGPVGFDVTGGTGEIDAVNHNGVTLVNALTANVTLVADPDDSNAMITMYLDPQVHVPGGAIVTFRARPARNFYLREWGGVCAGEPGGQDESESQVLVKEVGRHSALATGEGRICVVEVRTGITVTAIWDASSIGPEVRGYADGVFGDMRVTAVGQILPLVETALTQTLDYAQYYGVRRGLHWLITKPQQDDNYPGRFPSSQQDETCGNVRVAGACRYRAQAVCDRAGPNWRTPDFSEVAGLLEPAGNTYTFPTVSYVASYFGNITVTYSGADYFPEYGWQAEKTVNLWDSIGSDSGAFSGTVAFSGTYSKDGFGARVLPLVGGNLGNSFNLAEVTPPPLVIRDSHFACVSQAPGYNRSIASPDRAALRMRVVLGEDNAPVALTANLFAGGGALTARVEAWRYDINGNETRLDIPLSVGEISGGGSAAQNYGRSVRVMPDGLVEIVVSRTNPNYTPASDVRFEIVAGALGGNLRRN